MDDRFSFRKAGDGVYAVIDEFGREAGRVERHAAPEVGLDGRGGSRKPSWTGTDADGNSVEHQWGPWWPDRQSVGAAMIPGTNDHAHRLYWEHKRKEASDEPALHEGDPRA